MLKFTHFGVLSVSEHVKYIFSKYDFRLMSALDK